jgi:hypothetical protein
LYYTRLQIKTQNSSGIVVENNEGKPENELRSNTLRVKSTAESPDFLEMPMTTSRQLKQPQSSLALQYYLLHYGSKESPPHINLVRTTPELFDFYEVDIL